MYSEVAWLTSIILLRLQRQLHDLKDIIAHLFLKRHTTSFIHVFHFKPQFQSLLSKKKQLALKNGTCNKNATWELEQKWNSSGICSGTDKKFNNDCTHRLKCIPNFWLSNLNLCQWVSFNLEFAIPNSLCCV